MPQTWKKSNDKYMNNLQQWNKLEKERRKKKFVENRKRNAGAIRQMRKFLKIRNRDGAQVAVRKMPNPRRQIGQLRIHQVPFASA